MGYWKLAYSSYFNQEFQEKAIEIGLQLLAMLSLVDTRPTDATASSETSDLHRKY